MSLHGPGQGSRKRYRQPSPQSWRNDSQRSPIRHPDYVSSMHHGQSETKRAKWRPSSLARTAQKGKRRLSDSPTHIHSLPKKPKLSSSPRHRVGSVEGQCPVVRGLETPYYITQAEGDGSRHVLHATAALMELHQSFEDELLQMNGFLQRYSLRGQTDEDSETTVEDDVREMLHANICHNTPTRDQEESTCSFSAYRTASSLQATAVGVTLDLSAHPDGYHHYLIDISPTVNFKTYNPTTVTNMSTGMAYSFTGFSLLSAVPFDNLPPFKLQRYGGEYTISLRPHPMPESFVVKDLLLFEDYVFVKLLELYDWAKVLQMCGCTLLFFPRFIRKDEDSRQCEVLPMAELLRYLLQVHRPLESRDREGRDSGLLVTHPDKAPACIRADRLDSSTITHYSSYRGGCAGSGTAQGSGGTEQDRGEEKEVQPKVKKPGRAATWKEQGELKKVSKGNQKRKSWEVAVELNSAGFLSTGLHPDVAQHVMILPILTHQLLFDFALNSLEDQLQYKFKSRLLLQRALTHISYVPMHGTTGSHEEAAMSNCGLYNIVSVKSEANSTGKGLSSVVKDLQESCRATHDLKEDQRPNNLEQLEFLGDAILEYLCSLHLYHLFPDLSDGELTNYRRALVKNHHLMAVARSLNLCQRMLLGGVQEWSTDVSSRSSADCVEAILAAVFLDGGLEEAQKLLARIFFPEENLRFVWLNYPPDPLQLEHPQGDRHTIPQTEFLQKLVTLEQSVGIQFQHIRLLAKAFTHPSVPYNNLSRGNYQRQEFLGDAVLQFLSSLHVYSLLPTHREGHLSLARTQLVHNKQLARVSLELGFDKYILSSSTQEFEFTTKIQADVFESFLATLLLDKGLVFVRKFLEICLFPKLQELVCSSWSLLDASSRLHNAAVYTCKHQGTALELPHHRTLQVQGPSNKQMFRMAVYFRDKRIGHGTGPSLREARAAASESALASGHLLIPLNC